MKLVIDIPENTYKQIQALARNNYFEHDICGNSMRRIANGTPLPKGHGRLIDADKLHMDYCNDNCGERKCIDAMDRCVFIDAVLNAPTIIEANGGEKDEVSD